ncbi:hypothetical protein EPO15_10395, partial [bacterium]
MRQISEIEVRSLLAELGICAADTLLVHSALQFLGVPEGGPGMYLRALEASLGPKGNIVVPTFNFGFCRGQEYDPATTPSELGVFSELVRRDGRAMRSPHPLQSFAAIGPAARDLAGRDTPSAFDPGSTFERLLELNGRLLLLGADVQAASAIHYSEQRLNVPYRFWKEFHGRVRCPAGLRDSSCRMFVRDLDVDVQLDLSPIRRHLSARGAWKACRLNYGEVSVCNLKDFVAAG